MVRRAFACLKDKGRPRTLASLGPEPDVRLFDGDHAGDDFVVFQVVDEHGIGAGATHALPQLFGAVDQYTVFEVFVGCVISMKYP